MSIFNQPIDPKIVGSLTRRQELMGRENRTPKELSFLNSQTAWVSLKSSVNITNNAGENDKGQLAKTNILLGGTSISTLLGSPLKSGISSDSSGAYSLKNSDGSTNLLGVKPMPGIISVSVDNIGAYGSLRKATVNFQCWDIKQLEILEKLYMRPGYTVLLEFGRTSYINEKDKIINTYDDLTFLNQEGVNLQEYLNKLHKKSLDQEGNYDAFFGYITNYGWNARNDGGYDCKTEIISTGELIESLKVNYSLAGAINYKSLSDTPETPNFKGLLLPSSGLLNTIDKTNTSQRAITQKDLLNLNNEYTENIIAGLMYELYLMCTEDSYVGQDKQIVIPINGKNIIIDYNTAEYTSSTKTPKGDGKFNAYITLRSFIDLFNALILPKSFDKDGNNKGELVSLSIDDRSYVSKDPLLCLYNPLVLSTNPDICWVKNDNWTTLISKIKIDKTNITPINPTRSRDKDIQNGRAVRAKIIGWIDQLVNGYLDTKSAFIVVESILSYINTGDKNAKIDEINKNYIFLRGGKNLINPRIYDFRLYNDEGGSKKALLNDSERYGLNRTVNLGNLIRATDKDVASRASNSIKVKEIADLLLSLQKSYPEIEQETQVIQDEINTALNNQSESEKNNSNLVTISNNFNTFNQSFFKDFVVTGGISNFGEIGNIYLNVKNLWQISKDPGLSFQDATKENKLSVSAFIKRLLQDIQTSLCNINKFELHIDPIDSIGRIIDVNYINKNKPDLFKFEIGSNKSIVRDLKLESQIFSDQSSIIAISAQDTAGALGSNNSTLVGFNEGITDRMILRKDSYLNTIYDREKKEQTIINNYVSSLSFITNNYLKALLGLTEITTLNTFRPSYAPLTLDQIQNNQMGYKGETFDPGQALSYSDALRDIIYFFSSVTSFNLDNTEREFIPTLLSLTIDGLSGFIIGNLFKVDNKFVPNYYKKGDKLGYILTKVNHELSNNDWITIISGYPFNLESNNSNTNFINTIVDRNIILDIDPNPVGNANQLGSQTRVRSELVASFNDEILKINQKYGSKYSSIVGARLAQLKNKTFENAMKTIFETMAQDNILKNEKITLKSILRPNDIGSKHFDGRALDFNLSDATINEFKDFKNITIPKDKLYGKVKPRIDRIENFLKSKFPGRSQSTSYLLQVNGIQIEMTNEYYNPSPNATGPHFHFELQF